MTDKEKILEAAQKYVLKGQTKKAIKEYLKLIEASPKDKRLYLKVGDLYLKEGESDKAIKVYLELADLYMEDDLNFRAISVYKKILSIDPKFVEPLSKLAELYLKEGLTGSAKTYYQNILDINPDDYEALAYHFERAGESEQARIFHLRAAEQAAELADMKDAADHFQAALENWPGTDPDGRAAIEEKLENYL